MIHEIDLFGVFLPDLLVWIVVAFFLNIPLRHLLSWLGVYRLVWHRPLFDTAVYILLLGGTVATARGFLS
jgi:hypothetical protein